MCCFVCARINKRVRVSIFNALWLQCFPLWEMWWLLRSDLSVHNSENSRKIFLLEVPLIVCIFVNMCMWLCMYIVYVCRWKRPIALLGWHISQDCRRASFRRSRPLQTISPFLLLETHTIVLQYPIALHKHTHTHDLLGNFKFWKCSCRTWTLDSTCKNYVCCPCGHGLSTPSDQIV